MSEEKPMNKMRFYKKTETLDSVREISIEAQGDTVSTCDALWKTVLKDMKSELGENSE